MSLDDSYAHVCDQITQTGHPVHLIAISKRQPLEAIRHIAELGQKRFGENYVQELVTKAEALSELNLDWHFVGHLQRNKVNQLLTHISTIHSIDSIKLAETIASRAQRPINGFIEINIGGETSKTGLLPNAIKDTLHACSDMSSLNIKGLMCIPPPTNDITEQKKQFMAVADLQHRANAENWYRQPLADLSMGMSHDFLVAIACGATYVRIGTSIFGERI